MPAMPVTVAQTWSGNSEMYLGLTKRELFAMAAMQGLLSQGADLNGMRGYEGWREQFAKETVEFADSLLSELEQVRP
jgi:hypothetical protein